MSKSLNCLRNQIICKNQFVSNLKPYSYLKSKNQYFSLTLVDLNFKSLQTLQSARSVNRQDSNRKNIYKSANDSQCAKKSESEIDFQSENISSREV